MFHLIPAGNRFVQIQAAVSDRHYGRLQHKYDGISDIRQGREFWYETWWII